MCPRVNSALLGATDKQDIHILSPKYFHRPEKCGEWVNNLWDIFLRWRNSSCSVTMLNITFHLPSWVGLYYQSPPPHTHTHPIYLQNEKLGPNFGPTKTSIGLHFAGSTLLQPFLDLAQLVANCQAAGKRHLTQLIVEVISGSWPWCGKTRG